MSDPRQPDAPHTPSVPAAAHGHGASAVEKDEVSAGVIGIIGVFAAVVLFLIVVLLQAWFYSWKSDLTAANTVRADDPDAPLGRMLVQQQAQINSYHWISREQGTRAIPVDRAMELVAQEMAASQPAAPREAPHAP